MSEPAEIIPMPIVSGNTLPMLAEKIRNENNWLQRFTTEGLEKATTLGKLLHEARNLVKRTGASWERWLEDNTDIAFRTAAWHMQVARTLTPEWNLRHAARKAAASVQATTVPAEQPKAKRPPAPKETGKGRFKVKRRVPGSEPLKQDFFPNIPTYLEEMLLTMERSVVEYELPNVEATAKAIIAHRIKVEHFNEIIQWLTRLRAEVHHREDSKCGNTS